MLTIGNATPADQNTFVMRTLAAYSVYVEMIPPEFWAGYRKNIFGTLRQR